MIDKLVEIVRALRGPEGCPWDKVQTFTSLAPYVIEEAYELADTLERGDISHLQEELGDVLLHVVMLSLMAEELGHFGLSAVIDDISEKMIRRHPHVFGTTKADSVDEVLTRWEAIKQQEKPTQSVLDSIPLHLPALSRALKLQKRAVKAGFDWVTDPTSNADWGEKLFALVNDMRQAGIDPEQALRAYNQDFGQRFLDRQP